MLGGGREEVQSYTALDIYWTGADEAVTRVVSSFDTLHEFLHRRRNTRSRSVSL